MSRPLWLGAALALASAAWVSADTNLEAMAAGEGAVWRAMATELQHKSAERQFERGRLAFVVGGQPVLVLEQCAPWAFSRLDGLAGFAPAAGDHAAVALVRSHLTYTQDVVSVMELLRQERLPVEPYRVYNEDGRGEPGYALLVPLSPQEDMAIAFDSDRNLFHCTLREVFIVRVTNHVASVRYSVLPQTPRESHSAVATVAGLFGRRYQYVAPSNLVAKIQAARQALQALAPPLEPSLSLEPPAEAKGDK